MFKSFVWIRVRPNSIANVIPLILFSVFLLPFNQSASAYSCKKNCSSECGVETFFGTAIEPYCYQACKGWALINCYDVSTPLQSGMGEMGARAYPAAASIMRNRNINGSRPLNAKEKQILSSIHGNTLDRVVIHENALLMGEWGETPFDIKFSNDAGQTYGHDVYLKDSAGSMDLIDWIGLIGHEICHTVQYEARNSNFSKFGREYFEGYAKAGGYEANPMEVECQKYGRMSYAKASKFQLDDNPNRKSWNLQICNDTSLDVIYGALGWNHKLDDGFSLVPMPLAVGWYAVNKGACSVVQADIGEESLDLFVMGSVHGKWESLVTSRGPEYCVDPTTSFRSTDREGCTGNAVSANFFVAKSPWRTSDFATNTVRVTGAPTSLNVCNRTSEQVSATMLRNTPSGWRSDGWYVYQPEECKLFPLGWNPYQVYMSANSSTKKWNDESQPGFCVFDDAFNLNQNEICPTSKGARIEFGVRIDLSSGQNQWDFK